MKLQSLMACLLVALAVGYSVGCSEEKQSQSAPSPSEAPAVAPVLEPPREFDACKDGDCLVVPEGIIGTVFGMNVAATKDRFGSVRERAQPKRRVKSGPTCSERQAPPGVRYRAKTELGGEKATCLLEFFSNSPADPELGLQAISCELNGRRDRQEHAETANVLFRSLAKQYGAPQRVDERLVVSGLLSASWTSDVALLEVRAKHRGVRSSITLRNVSSKVDQAYTAEKAAVQARCDARAAARQSKATDEEERLREKARQFEADLRPPLERPKE